MNYIKLTGEGFDNYGLFCNKQNIILLQDYARKNNIISFPILMDNQVVTVLEIQGEFVGMKGEYCQGIQEYNESLRIFVSNNTARWRFLETEYKFNVEEDIDYFYYIFDTIKLDDFHITSYPQNFNSIETMFYKFPDSYFSLLKWEKDTEPNAIKIKKTISFNPILTRDSIIIDYNAKSLLRAFHLFNIDSTIWKKYSTTFFKKKKRHIAIDCETGYIFGISCNISHVKENWFCQVEIEYWSELLPKNLSNQKKNKDSNNAAQIRSHLKLVNSMNRFFILNKIKFNNIQLTKNEWLQHIMK